MFDYPAIAALSAIIREGSFERAAETLHITPSAISQRVKLLEERLGTILIIRGQPCQPTDLARKLCAHYDQILLLEADLIPALKIEENSEVAPIIKIAVNADSLASWFPDVAKEFSEQSKALLDITLDDEAYTTKRLRSGEVLAAVTSDPKPVQGCKTTLLGSLKYVACVSPDFWQKHFSKGFSIEAFSQAPYMRFDRRDMMQQLWVKEVYDFDLLAPFHRVASTQAFLDFALRGVAWGLQPYDLAKPYLETGALIELPPYQPLEINLYWTITRLHATPLTKLTAAIQKISKQRLA